MVADREVLDALADRLDDPSALVAEDRRRIAGRVDSGRGVEIGMADAAGNQAHERLAGSRVVEVKLLDDQRLAELLQYRGTHLHRIPPPLTGRSYARQRARAAFQSFFVASSETTKWRFAVRVARPRRSSFLSAAGHRLQRGPDLQHFFLTLIERPFGTAAQGSRTC